MSSTSTAEVIESNQASRGACAQRSESILRQPPAVWAIAFACVVSFMGIGLVDPILPSIAAQLHASPSQTELLFTTYLALTGVTMFFTSWVSGRIGVKKTILLGLAFVVTFAVCAGASPSVTPIIGFRAGWGMGNALFISTALAAIVGAAAGGIASAIILYEAALGLGMAIGPLVGGTLGSISWRGPFFGTATLMLIGFVCIAAMLRVPASPARGVAHTRVSAPFTALKVPGMGVMGIASFFYNMAFFTLLAYPPFALGPLGVTSALTLGFVFFGWGVLVAVSAVFVAPRLTRRLRRTVVLRIAMPLLALDLIACAVLVHSLVGLVIFVILAGAPLGVLNTVLTECSMEATDLPRAVASSTYSGCRFLGGAVAPPFCTWLAEQTNLRVPFLYGAAAILLSALIVHWGRNALRRADFGVEALRSPAAVAG